MRIALIRAAILICPLLALLPAPADAMQPEEARDSSLPAVLVIQQPVSLDNIGLSLLDWRTNQSDVRRLAGIICAEACGQPWPARVAIAQIVTAEASRRRMTVCELSERTWFVSVYRYALAHPDSWTARQFAAPQPWAVELARAVLDGRLPDATQGAAHFDGADHAEPALWHAGQIRFFR